MLAQKSDSVSAEAWAYRRRKATVSEGKRGHASAERRQCQRRSVSMPKNCKSDLNCFVLAGGIDVVSC